MRVLNVPNRDNPAACEAASRLASWLEERGHEVLMTPEDASACGIAEEAFSGLETSAELVVALGGDGTILRASRLSGADVPVLGVNLGRLGFLSGADSQELERAVEAAISGEARIEPRMTLEVSVDAGGREAGRVHALNEVYVGRSAQHRVVELSVAVNGTPLYEFYCDGLIVATPTGSTAYALSYGGPIVSPEVEALVLVPGGAHDLSARPMVLSADDTVAVSFPNPRRADVCVSVDGQQLPCRQTPDTVEVRRGAVRVQLVKFHPYGFYELVKKKLIGD